MNLVRGRIEGGRFTAIDGTGWKLNANGHAPPEGPAIYGIRPEHLRIDPEGIPATVQLVEPTGSETQVMMRLGDTPLVGAFRERVRAQPGDKLPIRPDASLAHLFHGETGQRL
jgi:multiple sugar transport system ATP-binding protein